MLQGICRARLVVLVVPLIVCPGYQSANSDIHAAIFNSQTSEAYCGQQDASSAATSVAAIADTDEAVLDQTRRLTQRIKSASFPELEGIQIQVELFHSDADFFRTRFAVPQFLFSKKLRYLLKVNPKVSEFQAPEQGLEAIIAHELSHVVYYAQGNRLRLFGLTRLLSRDFTARFERWSDLQAISRGYGESLKMYRLWLYRHVPQNKLEEKRRNYLSPVEIDTILSKIHSRPELLDRWLRDVPRNLKEIEKP
jgi:hypothetical protein